MQGMTSQIPVAVSLGRAGHAASRVFLPPVEGDRPLPRIINWEHITMPPRSRVVGMKGSSGQCRS